MPLHTILKVLVLALLFTSCIPTKKIVYLDSEEFKAPYSLDSWEYKIRTGDRFYIKITDPNAGITFGQSMDVNVQTDDAVNLIQQIPSVHDYIVLEDGSIDLPLLGKISAKDKTVMELTTLIRESCAGYITSPSVKLFMTNYNVTLLGEFNKPGQYQLITNKPTIFDAIGMGNDFTDYARREKVKLIRTNTDGVSITYLDLTDPNFVSSPYYYVQPNDVIHVMPLKVKKYSSDNALPLIISAMSTLILLYSIIITR
ncbi:MAG: polysaccharide biosynthesis/export family protein [Salibacteraceae bacterium]